ncbi:nitroreductase/quinone reductase family protein [Nonomuraea lactucae]|uniref:nitroreductase/quinone reductase family protein n=1 Tax=Nonomuraea lactucae TaxID=2249762 RepID=UPI000DE49CC2|nr:nitroreductase/quinone reductase family protein [Nonomuraea lactucae]
MIVHDSVRRAIEITPASSARDRTIDITTIGRRTGLERRIEIWFYRALGRTYLSGLPSRPSWYLNLLANPEFTFHLKNGVRADLRAKATPITDEAERRRIFTEIVADLNQPSNPGQIDQPTHVEDWVRGSRLMEVTFLD